MKAAQKLAAIAVGFLLSGCLLAQGTANSAPAKSPDAAQNSWAYSITLDGYVIPDGTSYASPTFTADHDWLHLEARYNYENLRTGSLWAGYNFSTGKTLVLNITPMIGGVFGRTTGISPGLEASLTYKTVEISISNEYVFDTTDHSGSFYYSWPQLTYSPLHWFRVGLVAQRTKAFHTPLDVQRGFLLGVSHKKWQFTTYIFNVGFTGPSVVLETGVSF
ncbi:MAG: hypothetical protein WBW33_07780 [Bryobacteraceae bacterium]